MAVVVAAMEEDMAEVEAADMVAAEGVVGAAATTKWDILEMASAPWIGPAPSLNILRKTSTLKTSEYQPAATVTSRSSDGKRRFEYAF